MKQLSNLRKYAALSILFTLFLMLAAAPAQEKDRLEQRAQKLQKELNLTDEQTGQVRQILEYNHQQAQKEREENRGNPEALQNVAKARRETVDQQMKNLLTAEQYTKYQEISKNAPVEEMTIRLQERLNLTDEQTGQVEKILLSAREERQKQRENASGDRRQMLDQMRSMLENRDKQIEALLTEEQKKIYQEIKKERREEMRQRMQGEKAKRDQ